MSTPAAPTNLGATAVSSSQVILCGTDNSNRETGFKVNRCRNRNGGFSQIAIVSAKVSTYPAPD
jgi:hypothetical protein